MKQSRTEFYRVHNLLQVVRGRGHDLFIPIPVCEVPSQSVCTWYPSPSSIVTRHDLQSKVKVLRQHQNNKDSIKCIVTLIVSATKGESVNAKVLTYSWCQGLDMCTHRAYTRIVSIVHKYHWHPFTLCRSMLTTWVPMASWGCHKAFKFCQSSTKSCLWHAGRQPNSIPKRGKNGWGERTVFVRWYMQSMPIRAAAGHAFSNSLDKTWQNHGARKRSHARAKNRRALGSDGPWQEGPPGKGSTPSKSMCVGVRVCCGPGDFTSTKWPENQPWTQKETPLIAFSQISWGGNKRENAAETSNSLQLGDLS